MSGQTPHSRTVGDFPAAREHRGFRGIVGAALVSLGLWAFLMIGALGLVLKILG